MALLTSVHANAKCDSPPTPPEVYYSDHEAELICQKLGNEETFPEAASILIKWLKNGKCTKRNACIFYPMIKKAYYLVMNFNINYRKHINQLNETKNSMLTDMEDICEAASSQKCWDQFNDSQKINISLVKRLIELTKNHYLEKVIKESMELSDTETDECDPDFEEMKKQYENYVDKYADLINFLSVRLKAVEDEFSFKKLEHKVLLQHKDNEIAYLRQALRESEFQHEDMLCVRQALQKSNMENMDLKVKLNELQEFREREARFIAPISVFLKVHPLGANIDCICAYLKEIDASVRAKDVEDLLNRYPVIFREDSIGSGANKKMKWHYIGP